MHTAKILSLGDFPTAMPMMSLHKSVLSIVAAETAHDNRHYIYADMELTEKELAVQNMATD